MKKPTKKWQGLHPHRYADNPLERKLALAWAEFNKAPNGGTNHLDYLMDKKNKGCPPATDAQRLTANTVIQWLGSPVGLAWLVDNIGEDVAKEMNLRAPSARRSIRPGQVYLSLDKRYEGREIEIEETRHAPGSPRYKTGPYCKWRVRNRETGRRSYIQERHLLDGAQWRLV